MPACTPGLDVSRVSFAAYPVPGRSPGSRPGSFPRGQEGKAVSETISPAGCPRRLDVRYLRRHVIKAAGGRHGYAAPWALLGIERGDGHVMIRLNSGGNALAVESWLAGRGYRATFQPLNPGVYGAAVRVAVQGEAAAPGTPAACYGNPMTSGRPLLAGLRPGTPAPGTGEGAIARS
jgi:hypothetical protein